MDFQNSAPRYLGANGKIFTSDKRLTLPILFFFLEQEGSMVKVKKKKDLHTHWHWCFAYVLETTSMQKLCQK